MASVWAELKRRKVVKVAVAYAVVGWLLVEVAATVLPIFEAPNWILQVFTFFVILGLPLALVLSWAYELTPEGVRRNDEALATESTTRVAGRKIDFVIIGALLLALGFVVVDNYVFGPPPATAGNSGDGPSIAVLPFSNQSADEEDAEFFATGMHDELLTRLAKIGDLKVISRTSVMQYANTQKTMQQIGRELGVATLLEGGVQRAGDMIRINVQLIDALSDVHIWSEIYGDELTAGNIFAIQSRMTTQIAEALEITLLPDEAERIAEVPTQSTRAWEFYLSGKDYANQPDEQTYMPLAIQQFERALAEDPDFALASAAMSRAHSELFFNGIDRTATRRRMAEEALREAQRLAPESPETHLALSYYHYFVESDYDRALEELAIAREGMPGDSRTLGGGIFRRAGRWEESLAAWARAYELDPRNIDQLENYAETHRYLHNFGEAEQLYDRILEIAPDSATVYFDRASIPLWRDGDVSALRMAAENASTNLGRFRAEAGWTAAFYERQYDSAIAYLDDSDNLGWRGLPESAYYGITHQLAGRPELAEPYLLSAREELEAALDGDATDDPFRRIYLAEILAHLGERESAMRLARDAMELLPPSRDAFLGPFIQVTGAVNVFLPAGDYEAALQELDRYFSAPSHWTIEGLSADPRLDPIRDDPRFLALVERYGRP